MEYTDEHRQSAVSLLMQTKNKRISQAIRKIKESPFSIQLDKQDFYRLG